MPNADYTNWHLEVVTDLLRDIVPAANIFKFNEPDPAIWILDSNELILSLQKNTE